MLLVASILIDED